MEVICRSKAARDGERLAICSCPLPTRKRPKVGRADEHGLHGQRVRSVPDQASAQLAKEAQDYIAMHFATEINTRGDCRCARREPVLCIAGVSALYGHGTVGLCKQFPHSAGRELLEHSDMTVTEIAFAAGFNEPAYFSRMFRKFTGKSPRHFRRINNMVRSRQHAQSSAGMAIHRAEVSPKVQVSSPITQDTTILVVILTASTKLNSQNLCHH